MTEKKRRVSNAPRPISPVGSSWTPPKPRLIQLLLDWPPYYPIALIPETEVILGKAMKQFPKQAEILPLCLEVVGKLTPHFCRAVQVDGLRAGLALHVIRELIRYLLIANCNRDSPDSTRLEQEVRKSEAWATLTSKIAKAGRDAAVKSVPVPPPPAIENAAADQEKTARPKDRRTEFKTPWMTARWRAVVSCGVDAPYKEIADWIAKNVPADVLPPYCAGTGERDLGHLVRHNPKVRTQFRKDVDKAKAKLRD